MNERHVDRRKAMRFPVVVPVEVKWQEVTGRSVRETAQAKEVNAQGGLLDMKTYPSVGSYLELTNLLSGEAFRARAVAIRRSKEGHVSGVAVELLIPSETVWGVNFQLKKTSAELVRLEQTIKSGSVDARILMEFRDAVDYVRKTAWAVREWQERQLQKHDPQTVLPLITTERIRRATQLNKAIRHCAAVPDPTVVGNPPILGPIGLGFRVPMLLISPFSRGGFVSSALFDHTSVLRFLETRFGAEVPNLTAWRRATVGDLGESWVCVADAAFPWV